MCFQWELEFIRWIHAFRNHGLDQFFKYIDFFDRQEFFFVLIPILWATLGWRTGLRIFYIFVISGIVNYELKQLFVLARPFHVDPILGVIQVSGYGLPSGAAQTVMLLSAILVQNCKQVWKWMIVIPYVVIVSFSRMYLGVHFPSDIIAGWSVGLGLSFLYSYGRPLLEQWLFKLSSIKLALLSQAAPLFFWLCSRSSYGYCCVASGLGIGVFITYQYGKLVLIPKNRKEYIFMPIIFIFGTFLLYFLISLLPHRPSLLFKGMQYFTLGVWVSLGSPFVCRTLLRMKTSFNPLR